ncbi:MAG: glycosyltransferase family 1 protein [Planctomycetes bacterium]|nr:glycosyltransferase family 1 protein [Planctomycetota bacterium]
MMAEIAKCDFINRLIFVDPLVSIRSIFKHKNSNHNVGSDVTNKIFPSKVTPKIFVYTPIDILPNRRYLTVLKRIGTKIKLKIIRRLNKGRPYILFMNCPNISLHYVLDKLLKKAECSIFDFSDDFLQLVFCDSKAYNNYNFNMTKYSQAADIVLTVNEHLKDKYSYLNTKIQVIRNATNYYNFNRKNYKCVGFLERLREEKKPIVGYIGIANWIRIDFNLLDFLLKKREGWHFVFVGPADSSFIERYARFVNVHLVPTVDYKTLPDYIHYFDVATVPFQINEHTKGNDLLKLNDYLAMGKPIVSTEIGGANDLREVIRVAQGPTDFLEEIEKALFDNKNEDVFKRKSVALKNSWHNRIKQLEELIKNNMML